MIRAEERDAELELDGRTWPGTKPPPDTWEADPQSGLFLREIGAGETPEKLATPLKEQLLRFPSAPIHGLHRLSQDHINMGPVESFHSYRLLSHPKRRARVTRIFLMHNGLNETLRIGLYYQLASYLIAQDPGTVCLLRPLPGHLTRSASPGLSETPLDHYLWDGLHLFRQFLRYMIETRWLLSTVVRYSYYHCVSGSGLLKESKKVRDSRLTTSVLATAMQEEWKALRKASAEAIDKYRDGKPEMPPEPPFEAFRQSITSMRKALRLDQHYPRRNGRTFSRNSEPELHAIGYSLGGFAAQSVFMSWPFLVSSCSTLLSGGAMRELAPTAFADPEEWQTVLHSLRYELDDAMMDWRFQRSGDGTVAGINPYLFLFLKRTFYEVFQQEYRGSFQTRLVAFRQRMLFVVGGNDPIVRPQSVLDSGPPDGINLIAIGGLGHFLEGATQGEVETEQRSFWLPEIGQTISHLSKRAATKHRKDMVDTWLDENDRLPEPSRRMKRKTRARKRGGEAGSQGRLSIAERLKVARDGTLPSLLFQRSLDDLLARAVGGEAAEDGENGKGEGLLFILKNEPPTFLLDDDTLQQHAAALYHEDVRIVDHIDEVRSRRPMIEGARKRIGVVLPWNVETVVREIDAGLQHPSQSESSGEQVAEIRDTEETPDKLLEQCCAWTKDPFHDSIRIFDGRDGVDCVTDPLISARMVRALTDVARERLGITDPERSIKPALPDCWVWISNEFLGFTKQETPTLEEGRRRLCEKAPAYVRKGATKAEQKAAEQKIAEQMRTDDLRMVTISRARYNPRFRGRIIAEPRQAQELLLRVALCIVSSVPFRDHFKDACPPDEAEKQPKGNAGGGT